MEYFYECAKKWFSLLVNGYETSKEQETCIDPETGLQLGVPVYIQPGSPVHSQVSAEEEILITPKKSSYAEGSSQIVPGSEPRAKPLTAEELEAKVAETTKPDATLKDDSSDEETDEKDWVKEVISKESTKSYSESYSESIADLSNALSNMDTTALSAALNGERVDIQSLLRGGKSTKACQIIAKIMFNEQFGSARDIGTRGKDNKQQMKEIWGDTITKVAKSNGSLCYLCTGQLVPGGQAEMEHRMRCGEFYGIFAYIYSLYPKELAEWRYYVNKLADDDFKQNLLHYYNAINMGTINEAELNTMYNNIIQQFKRDTGIIDTNGEYAKFTKLLRAYLHEFAYAHHVCNQIKCDNDLDNMKNVNNYYSVLDQHLNMVQPGKYGFTWKHMQINPDFSKAEIPQIEAGLEQTDLDKLKTRIIFQMKLLKKFSGEIAYESGQTQNRMILRILKDALINMKDKKDPTDPSKRIIEQARLLAQGDSFYNNDITDAFDFNKDFKLPEEKRDDRLVILFSKRLPRFLERIEIILENTNYQNGPNTLGIIDKCLKSPNIPDKIRLKILLKLNSYIGILNEINTKVNIILNYTDLPNKATWTRVRNYLNNYLSKLKGLVEVKREIKSSSTSIPIEAQDAKMTIKPTSLKPTSLVSIGRPPQSSSTATFALRNTMQINAAEKEERMKQIEAKMREDSGAYVQAEAKRRADAEAVRRANAERLEKMRKRKEAEKIAAQNARRAEAKRLRAEEAIRQQAERLEAERLEIIRQNEERDKRVANKKPRLNGGRRQKVRTMRKIKGRPRKATMRAGRRNRTMKRKPRSRKNTRRR
jgi:hypothetical protein